MLVVVTVDTSRDVADVWLFSAVYHVHNSLDHWLLVHCVDDWGLCHSADHWLLVDGVRVCALVDCPGGRLVCDGVYDWGLEYGCGGVPGTSGHRDVAWLKTQQVVVGLCVCQLGALRLCGDCRCVCACGEVHVWVVEGTVYHGGDVRDHAWVFAAED